MFWDILRHSEIFWDILRYSQIFSDILRYSEILDILEPHLLESHPPHTHTSDKSILENSLEYTYIRGNCKNKCFTRNGRAKRTGGLRGVYSLPRTLWGNVHLIQLGARCASRDRWMQNPIPENEFTGCIFKDSVTDSVTTQISYTH